MKYTFLGAPLGKVVKMLLICSIIAINFRALADDDRNQDVSPPDMPMHPLNPPHP